MAGKFKSSCQFSVTDSSDNPLVVGTGGAEDTDRTLEPFNLIRTVTSGTTLTDVAVDLGDVADGAMEFGITNLSATLGQDISVSLDYSGTKRVICMVRAGQTRVLSLLSRPYVKAVALNVPYVAGVAAL
jgi:hypothetical protein